MTATTEQAPGSGAATPGVGRVARVTGPVVDVEFPVEAMPELMNALHVDVTMADEDGNPQTSTLTLEVAQHLGDNLVRAIAMQPTDGLTRGAEVSDTGDSITVPVGDVTQEPPVERAGQAPRCAGVQPRDQGALGHSPSAAGLRPARVQDRGLLRPASRSSTC